MSAAQTIAFPSRLESLETEAHAHLESMRQSWQAFVQVVLDIQASKLWQKDGRTWDSYCREMFQLSSTRIRQYKAAVPYAEIIESVTGVIPTENQVRNLREVVTDDELLIPVFKKALELAEDSPTKRHFEAVASVYEEARLTNAVSVAGESMPISAVTLNAGMQEAIIEADLRFRSHRGNSKKKPILITAQRQGDVWVLQADGVLPDRFEVKLWRDSDEIN